MQVKKKLKPPRKQPERKKIADKANTIYCPLLPSIIGRCGQFLLNPFRLLIDRNFESRTCGKLASPACAGNLPAPRDAGNFEL